MHEVHIAGVGMTRFAKQPDSTLKSLSALAVGDALADAGLTAGEIGAAFVANAVGGTLTEQEMIVGQTCLRPLGIDRIPVINVENACASAATAMHLAWQSVASGSVDVALALGVEKMSHTDKALSLGVIARAADMDVVRSEAEALGPDAASRSYFMDLYAGLSRDYMERTGATLEDFARVVVKAQHNGSLNPRAQYGSDMTIEDVLAGREVVWPLSVMMCSPISDGAAAAIVVSAGVAERLARTSVRVRGSAIASGVAPGSSGETATSIAAQRAYEMAAIGPLDADLVEVHDAAAPAELMLCEQLGLAARGDGPRLVRDGTSMLGGRRPVNASGGLLAKGHPIGATGLAQVFEAVTQLRGEAGERQVEGARVALLQNGGGWVDGDNAAIGVHVLVA